jgi:hypothetical protein
MPSLRDRNADARTATLSDRGTLSAARANCVPKRPRSSVAEPSKPAVLGFAVMMLI